jgi:hypothetical protein
VQSFCDRAMLIHDGEQRFLGAPDEAVLRYYRMNFASVGDTQGETGVRLVDVWLEDLTGKRIEDVPQGQPFCFKMVAEAQRDLPAPTFRFELLNVDDVPVSGFGHALMTDDRTPRRVVAGERVTLEVQITNNLVPGRYSVLCTISRSGAAGDNALHDVRVTDFLVTGSDPMPGMIFPSVDVEASVERASV